MNNISDSLGDESGILPRADMRIATCAGAAVTAAADTPDGLL
jgi:hypothetical protein